MKFAWVVDGIIRDVCPGDPASSYTPNVAANYSTVVPDLAKNGDVWDGTTLTPGEPPSPPPAPSNDKLLTRSQFMLRFTSAERVAIRAKVADTGAPDAALNDWWAILHDSEFEGVHTTATPHAKNALLYLVSINLLEADRVAEILA